MVARGRLRLEDDRERAPVAARPGRDEAALTGTRQLTSDIRLTQGCIAVTTLAATMSLASLVAAGASVSGLRALGELAVFTVVVAFLLYGNLVYQVCRLGQLRRRLAHRPAPRHPLSALLDDEHRPSVAVLVPSYREELRLVRQTLLAAALQEYPDLRVVLLIDDPPDVHDPASLVALHDARRLPDDLDRLLADPAAHLERERTSFRIRTTAGVPDLEAEASHVAALHDWVADWIDHLAQQEPVTDHTDRFFVERILRAAAAAHRTASATMTASPPTSLRQLELEHARLVSRFAVRLTSFERKRWVNLSHEPNKAMNLNSYIGLLGRRLRAVHTPAGPCLQDVRAATDAEIEIPAAEFLVTLDADSLLLPDYVLRLVHEMQQPEHERTAVAQTPYCAVPGATGAVERLAGATTDMMHIVHQGSTRYGATFWVGANALLRTDALRDIAETDVERGHVVLRFIQDRTVIEDTESTVDLLRRGWQLVNYPARLAYSATPPDYGSLLIQRRRWANGGLLVLPKLLRYAFAGSGRIRRVPEVLLRMHYLTSLAGVNVGLLLLLTYPFSELAVPLWLPLSAVPYFTLYARDLRQNGYRRGDVVRVYALNLLLVPVNLGGVVTSIRQGLTGRRIPFGRTPKVTRRTPAPALYILMTWGLLALWAVGTSMDAAAGRRSLAAFGLANVLLLGYALTRFVGWRAAAADAFARFRSPAETVGSDGTPILGPCPSPAVERRLR
jgi:cellulose synthase (UDP-forming)